MGKVSLSVAVGGYDRMQALRDGSVTVEGCDINVLTLGPEEIFFRAFGNAEFDVCELSASSYMIGTAQGTLPYVAIPVFASRAFRHAAIYVNRASGIRDPKDLRGRPVGVPEYQMTAALWVRGMLADEYDVAASAIRWRSGGLEVAGRHEKLALDLPDEVELEPIAAGETLNELLVRGEIDALVTARAPSCFEGGDDRVARLFPDTRPVEQAYFRKTGLFPIMHLIGVRRELVAAHPWLAASLLKAFTLSKQACMARLTDTAALHDTVPWLIQEVEETRAIMGRDFWPYGIDANRAALGAMTRYAYEQGLTDRRLTLAELFAKGTDEQFKI